MKKILNISVIAALAILPMAANAAVGDVVSSTEPAHADPATAASAAPGYALATVGANDGNLATAGYVKGAYNATMKAINKVATASTAYDNTTSGMTATTVQGAIDEVEGRVDTLETTVGDSNSGLVKDVDDLKTTVGTTTLTTTAQTLTEAVNELTDSANIDYDNSDSGLTATDVQAAIDEIATTAGNAADKDLSNLSATGTGVITTNVTNNAAGGTFSSTEGLSSVTLGTAIDELASEKADKSTTLSGYGITDAYTKTEVDTAIEGSANTATYSSATTYDTGTVGAAIKSLQTSGATQDGVENTIETATITATVPTLTIWNDDTSDSTVSVTVASIAATYAEPAQQGGGQQGGGNP